MGSRKRTRGVKREKKARSDLASLYELGATQDQLQSVAELNNLIEKSVTRPLDQSPVEINDGAFNDLMAEGILKSYFALNSAAVRKEFEDLPEKNKKIAEERREDLYARLEKTLRRLRQKGYCTETTMESFALRADKVMIEANPCLAVLPPEFDMFRFNRRKANRVVKKYNSEMWMQSIELACLLTKPESVFDMDNSTLVHQAESNIRLIYCLFFYLSLIAAYNVSEELRYRVEDSEKKAERIVREAKKEANKSQNIDREIEQAKKQAFETAERLKRQNKALEKELHIVKKENAWRKIQMELAEAESTEPEEDEEILDEEDPQELSDEELYRDIEVPDDGSIVFLGGHPSWLKKVHQLHPGWKYITSDNQGSDNIMSVVQGNIKFVICYWKHISHSMYNTLMNAIDDDTPIIYLNCHNLDRVEQQIRKQYAELVLGATNKL